MSNQLCKEFVFNANSPPIGLHDRLGLVPTQIVNPLTNNSVVCGNGWQTFGVNGSDETTAVADDVDYRLLLNDDDQQVPMQTGQNMSQIVLLPTQNINLVASVPKQEPLHMLVPNDAGYQLITSPPNVSVLVPTNILLSNGYILIPNSSNSCSNQFSLDTTSGAPTSVNSQVVSNAKRWPDSANRISQQQQQQIIGTNVDFTEQVLSQITIEPKCEYITLADSGTQTVLGALQEGDFNQTTHLLSTSNGQIVGIIGSDQLSLLQNETTLDSQPLLLAIDPSDGINLTCQPQQAPQQIQEAVAIANGYDINAVLASTLSTVVVEKTDQNQAKQWLKDSYIVNRALKALKKGNDTSSHHHTTTTINRPHSQVKR